MSTNVMTDALRAVEPRASHQRETDNCVLGMDQGKLTRFLGWFSIGLGAAEVLAPGFVARLIGTENHRGLLRFYGLRELAAGVGILTQPKPAGWLWSRVAGDMVDLASLGATLASPDAERGKTIAAVASVAGVTVLDILCAEQLTAQEREGGAAERSEASLMVNRQPEECYRFWRDFENLPRFMSYLQSVRTTGDRQSHWVAATPAGRFEWDAELMDDIPNQRISWRSLPGANVHNSGSVGFEAAPGLRGTIVRVQLDYSHPAQSVISPLARLMGKHPEQMIEKDLRRFKQVMEVGEVITTEGQSAGRRSGATWLDRIAR